MMHRVQNPSLGCALLNNALLQAKVMIVSVTLKYLEQPSLDPVSETLHLHFTHGQREGCVPD